jgi:hypothetical protein
VAETTVDVAFDAQPACAAWRHRDARDGFEVAFVRAGTDGRSFHGWTAAVQDGRALTVGYVIVASGWTIRSARVVGDSAAGRREVRLDGDGAGRWRVDGVAAPELDGCLDVDLESSALTNAFPVHRLGLAIGEAAEAPAVYVRAPDLTVERLEQRYVRLEDDRNRQRYHYSAPRFDFECRLSYDEGGFVDDYPGIAGRIA